MSLDEVIRKQIHMDFGEVTEPEYQILKQLYIEKRLPKNVSIRGKGLIFTSEPTGKYVFSPLTAISKMLNLVPSYQ